MLPSLLPQTTTYIKHGKRTSVVEKPSLEMTEGGSYMKVIHAPRQRRGGQCVLELVDDSATAMGTHTMWPERGGGH